jgi:GNAT superfamily N-acetyltransferase
MILGEIDSNRRFGIGNPVKKAARAELRHVRSSDADELARLLSTTFEAAYKDVHSPENIHAYCESNYSVDEVRATLQDASVVCKAAYRNDKAVGFFLIKHHNCPIPVNGVSSELKQIYVLSCEYGKGTGKLLFDEAIRCTKNANSLWVWLIVSDYNQRAQSFYRKWQFELLGAGPELIVGTDRLSSTVMALKVESPILGIYRLTRQYW